MTSGPGRLGETIKIATEELGGGASLTNFFFRYGANMYAITYQRDGRKRHILVDALDSRYRDELPVILEEGGLIGGDIERIVITHRHPDHCGLAYELAKGSGARITVHAGFRSFVEGGAGPMERRWMRDFDPSRLQECDVEYLSPAEAGVSINGVDFPSLGETIHLGGSGTVRILASPEATPTHSPDQVIVIYSPGEEPFAGESGKHGSRPEDDVIFSGDLWLMRGPMFDRDLGNLSHQFRHGISHLKSFMSGGGMPWGDPRDQDAQAKEALKKGFSLIKVKPGHGNDFLGTRLIPLGVLADRDILLLLGYSLNDDTTLLRAKALVSRVEALKEEAYRGFVRELGVWSGFGYSGDDIGGFLVRIYREQSGGGGLVENDRKQRRARIKDTLGRLSADEQQPAELRRLAEGTIAALRQVK